MTSRRSFLSAAAGSGLISLSGQAPAVLQLAAGKSQGTERILVVVELAGGNDGLNTVIPFADDDYRKARPKLAIPATDVLKVDDLVGLHPAMGGFSELLENGQLAVVQGVGYENPNRSHFESMDIWHTCQRKNEQRTSGWLGRLLEATRNPDEADPPALHLGRDKQPFALMSRHVRVPSINSLERFRLEGSKDEEFQTAVKQLSEAKRGSSNDLLGFVQSSTSSAISASERIETAGKGYKPAVSYPQSGLAQKLLNVARLIHAGLTATVYYVRIDGFDTHARQAGAHQSLLRQVSDGVSAFLKDIQAHDHGNRVLCLCFSEFGRRVNENASEGTDHGTAGPMFLAGNAVRPGLIGRHPSLSDLEQGDLKHHVDFRQVYATVLEDWLACDSPEILHGRYQKVQAIR